VSFFWAGVGMYVIGSVFWLSGYRQHQRARKLYRLSEQNYKFACEKVIQWKQLLQQHNKENN
jgi:hypothetical protein